MNKDDGTYPYEDMFITEFLPYVEKAYRIKKNKAYSALSDLSMGGAGTLRLGLKYHNIFGAGAAFSSAIFTEQEMIDNADPALDHYIGSAETSIKGLKAKARLAETYKDYDVLNLLKTEDAALLKTVDIYFDCGDDDFLTLGNGQLHIELKKKNIPHEYRVGDGAHTWNF